jgi:hypothetical protein
MAGATPMARKDEGRRAYVNARLFDPARGWTGPAASSSPTAG